MDISCAFATSSDSPAHVELAETLGYKHAWLYDSPALYPDVWMILSRCAERTSRIGLGPGVLVDQAPRRVVVAVGSGFTAGWLWASGRCPGGRSPSTYAA